MFKYPRPFASTASPGEKQNALYYISVSFMRFASNENVTLNPLFLDARRRELQRYDYLSIESRRTAGGGGYVKKKMVIMSKRSMQIIALGKSSRGRTPSRHEEDSSSSSSDDY